jgi:Spy/CpxP family protein refolding chaperone
MKKFLTIVVLTTFALAFSAISFAQDAGPQGGQLQAKRHGGKGGGLKGMLRMQHEVLSELKLTDDQKTKIQSLNKDLADKIKDIQKQNKGTEGNKNLGPQRREIRRDYDEKLHAILGDDLWRDYRNALLQKMKEAREKKDEKMGDGKP